MLNELHPLPMTKRISLLVLYKAMHGLTIDYITVLATPYDQQMTIYSMSRKLNFIMVISRLQ